MISIRKIAQGLWSVGLMIAIAMTVNLGLAHEAAWATTSTRAASTQIAWGFGNKAEATANEVKDNVRNAAEDVKTSVEDNVGLEKRLNTVQKNVEGSKLPKTSGRATGTPTAERVTDVPENQAMGKAKQAENQVRNTVEDVKSAAQDMFN